MSTPRTSPLDEQKKPVTRYDADGFHYASYEEDSSHLSHTKLRINLPEAKFKELYAASQFDRIFSNIPDKSIFQSIKWTLRLK